MKKLIPILLIFLTFSILQFGLQEEAKRTPKIGLLTFSVNAFDEESKKINAGLKALKDVIDRELKKSFQIMGEPPDEITYSDIELPEVTIDPVVEPETNKKLEKLCQKDWDGLVFGHFHQEDKLVVVTRFYLSKNKYPGIKKDERIISSPEIEIPTANLGQKSLETHTAQSIQELIEAIKTKRPEVFGLVKEEQPPKVKKSPKQEPKPTKQETKTAEKKKKPEIEDDYGVVPLTARDVYQMIIDNGFYCEIWKGKVFHGEAFKTIKEPKGKIFPYRRTVTPTIKNNLVKTRSIRWKRKTYEEEIVLEWSPKPIECSFQKAIEIIAKRNEIKAHEDKKWRIPTIMELFSIIVQGKKKNYFPHGFQLPGSKSITFWTSTPVKKEGTVLENDKENKAYFVVQLVFLQNKGEYSLRFDFQNIEQMDVKDIYLLPVYSEKVYTYTPLPGFDTNSKKAAPPSGGTDKIPGFDDSPGKNTSKKTVSPPSTKTKQEAISNKSPEIPQKIRDSGKIPGFDDVPNKSTVPQRPSKKEPTVSPPQAFKYGKKLARTVVIALFPYMSGIMTPGERRLLDDLNNAIKEALKRVEDNLKDNYNPKLKLKIKKMNPYGNDLSEITRFYNFLCSTNESDNVKVNNIKRHIMTPQNIDIIVTIIYFDSPINNPIAFTLESPKHRKAMQTFEPIIIDGFNDEIKRINRILQNKPKIQYDLIIPMINRAIIEIIKSEFEKRPGKKYKSRRR